MQKSKKRGKIIKAKKSHLDFLKDILTRNRNIKENAPSKLANIAVDKLEQRAYVEDVMTKNPVAINYRDSLSTAFEYMLKYKLDSLIVTKKDEPIGIISERDILSFISSSIKLDETKIENDGARIAKILGKRVEAAMNEKYASVEKTAPLEKAIELMGANSLSILPVVEGKHLVGVILEEDILNFIENRNLPQENIKEDSIETGIDKLLDLINKYGEITSKDAAESLGENPSKIEKWARILQSHNLIDIDFSKIGVIKLIKKEKDFF